ncbi:AAA domain-containing protein [Guyparkeria halophila]|uniref:AAA domain-containing protein n=1 Tax=Guyparkeria halophila TaxID=47960 RepID=A0A6I6D3G3_9GAMM|nr:sigma-54 dependent transcriptional regulator [Guyparkeria halophila]QGT78473.1 AAA domain-containing protein [Guyparkeria halophila]
MSSEMCMFRRLPMLSLRGPEAVEEVRRIAEPFFWEIVGVDDPDRLSRQVKRDQVRVALIDLRGAMQSAMSWLPAFCHQFPSLQLVAIIEKPQADNPAHASFLHAYFFDFCFAPIEPTRLTFSIGHAWTMARVADLHVASESACSLDGEAHEMVGRSEAMQAVRRQVRRYAGNHLPVLITGPTGTGKELAARSIHHQSDRTDKPFVAVNCGTLSPNLIQSELFGHEKGAFTGATKRRIGWVEQAQGGTLFLDEIGDLPLDVQVNLLRFLQQGEIQRVGGDATIAVDARIIAATHVDLNRAVLAGTFREDLLFRLDVLPLEMPPLAERGADVLELAEHYLARFCDELGVKRKRLTPATEAALRTYAWPGNIRELMNRLRRGIVLADGNMVSLPEIRPHHDDDSNFPTLARARELAERRVIAEAIARAGNNVTEAARLLDVSRCTLHRLIRKHDLSID